MAQGIRQGTEATFFLLEPKMWGKLVANAVADWMAGKTISPMLLLEWLDGILAVGERRLPVVETKSPFNLTDRCPSGDLNGILV